MRTFAIAGALATCACGTSFDHVAFDPIGGVPDGVSLGARLVVVPVGASVAARVVAFDGDGAMDCEPTLTSDDERIMRIERADRGSTVFTGVSAGETAIFVHCGGEDGVISGRVVEPVAK